MAILQIALLVAIAAMTKEVVHGMNILPNTTDTPGVGRIALGMQGIKNSQYDKYSEQDQPNSKHSPRKLIANPFSRSELSRLKRNSVTTSHGMDGLVNLTPKEREYYFKVLSMLSSRDSHTNSVNPARDHKNFVVQDEDNKPIELGYYGNNLYSEDTGERRPNVKHPYKSKVFPSEYFGESLDYRLDVPVDIYRHAAE